MVTRVIGVKIDGRQARAGAIQVQRALKDIKKTGDRTARGLKSVGRAVFSLRGAFAALGAGIVGKQLLDTAANLGRIQRALKLSTGGAEQAAEAMKLVGDTSDRLGLSLASAEEGFVTISAAARGTALEGKATEEIFLGISEASAAMGLGAEQTKGAMLALSQIISKGKVSAEELRGQLGERLPGAMQVAARAIGKTNAELDKLLVTGKLTAEDFLPLFAAQLRKEFGGAAAEAADSVQGAMNAMSNAVLRLTRVVAESDAMDPLVNSITTITELLEDDDFLAGVETAATAVGRAMKFLASNIHLVGVALQALVIGKLVGMFTNMAIGALRFAAGLKLATVAALASQGALTGMAAAGARATAGMTALRTVSMTLGGPVGILAAVATAAYLMWDAMRNGEKATDDLRMKMEQMDDTAIDIKARDIRNDITAYTEELEKAQDKLERARSGKRMMSRGPKALQRVPAVLDTNIAEAEKDVVDFTAHIQRLEVELASLSDTAGGELDPALQALRDKLDALGGSKDAENAVKEAREQLQGMVGDLELTAATMGQSEQATLRYQLTMGDLAADVALLGESGIVLRDRLIQLQGTIDSNEQSTKNMKDALADFEVLMQETRTPVEAYRDELMRLAEMYNRLKILMAGNEEGLKELTVAYRRAQKNAAESWEEAEKAAKASTDKMSEFTIQAARNMETAMADLFFNVMNNNFDDLADNFKRMIDRMVAEWLAAELLNKVGQAASNSSVDWIQTIGDTIAGFAGGTSGGGGGGLQEIDMGTIPARREQGGAVQQAQTYLVGERGPELFVPSENGNIIPNRSIQNTTAKASVSVQLDTLGGDLQRITTGRSGDGGRIAGRAGGGPVMRGQPIVVGEVGPEMFVGSKGGGGASAAPITINMTVNTPDAGSFRQSQGQIAGDMARSLNAARIRNG